VRLRKEKPEALFGANKVIGVKVNGNKIKLCLSPHGAAHGEHNVWHHIPENSTVLF
jgi:FKBP-type peptidyl-prolyl cis-trans isomerase